MKMKKYVVLIPIVATMVWDVAQDARALHQAGVPLVLVLVVVVLAPILAIGVTIVLTRGSRSVKSE
jgi:hypothetical protein